MIKIKVRYFIVLSGDAYFITLFITHLLKTNKGALLSPKKKAKRCETGGFLSHGAISLAQKWS